MIKMFLFSSIFNIKIHQFWKVTIKNATTDSWMPVRRTRSPGVAAPALSRGQEDSAASKRVDKTALALSHPQAPTVRGTSSTAEG